jgi:hypothetical protein
MVAIWDAVAPRIARWEENTLNAALIAVAGGLLTVYATRSIEAMRVRAALVEKAEERRLASIERLLLAVNAWLERTYAHEVRYLKPVTEEARNARIESSRFLREDLIDQLRPEVEALRDRVKLARRVSIS